MMPKATIEPSPEVKSPDVAPVAAADTKLKALTAVIGAISVLERQDRVDVLRAAASFYTLAIPMEPCR